ncbi:MAG: hypothetical protein JWP75_4127 [Frondihabitans sp.]|nr:hypothetical protein [Frondihabitans sp.]
MTTSNRFFNRFFLLVTGLITLAVGVALVLVALPGAGAGAGSARAALNSARDAQATALADTPLTGVRGVSGSYLPWLLAVLCLLVVIVALVAATTRGRGRIDRVLEADDPAGVIVLSSRFAETAVVEALSSRRDVANVSVAAYRLKGAPALKVRLRLTAGSSPLPAVEAASSAILGLDRVIGQGSAIPVLVEVTGASPVRPGADSRVS